MSKRRFDTPQTAQIQELSRMLLDVSKELEKKNQELEDANERLLRDHRNRTELYTNLSHDLRAPMNAIRNSIEYILNSDLDDKEELCSVLKLMENRTFALEKLIDDIFLLSRIDSNCLKTSIEDVNLVMLLEDYYYSNMFDGAYFNRDMRLEVPENDSVIVSIDTSQFIRILDNLINNAYKYSNDKDIIELGLLIEDSNDVIIYVKDTGIGIPLEDVDNIFERSYTVSKARTPDNTNSHGIGLAIVKGLVNNMEGCIWCNSELGKGTTMNIKLPMIR